MGHVFKQKYTVLDKQTGTRQLRSSKKWYIEYWDRATKKRVREVGYTDRRATEHLLREREQEADRVDAGYLPVGTAHAKVALSAHLENYLAFLRSKGNKAHHVALLGARCRTVLDGCGFERWRDLDATTLGNFLADMRAGKIKRKAHCRKSISAQTSNHYLQQFRSFVSWLAGRMQAVSPLVQLEPVNVDADRRHVRRASTLEEFSQLIKATSARGVLFGLAGPDRAMLYIVAAYTGYRASELASMTPDSMQMVGTTLAVTVEAGYAKNGRQDTVPMAAAVADRVKAWLKGKKAGASLWPGEWASQHHAAAMLRADLAAAGIAYKDDRGRVLDFHALRATYITSLAQAGVPLVHAQKLARHSTPVLTAKTYTLLEQTDLAAQAAKLQAPPTDENVA